MSLEVTNKLNSEIRLKVLKIYGHRFSGIHLFPTSCWKVGEKQTDLLISDFDIVFDMKEYIKLEKKNKDALINYIKQLEIKI